MYPFGTVLNTGHRPYSTVIQLLEIVFTYLTRRAFLQLGRRKPQMYINRSCTYLRNTMTLDDEISAMRTVATALGDLEDEAVRGRVLRWAAEHFGITVPQKVDQDGRPATATKEMDGNHPSRSAGFEQPNYQEFVDLFDAVDPTNDVDKALTAAFWLQMIEEQSSWQAQPVNNLLKDTGHGITNVTSALQAAQDRKPALVRQMAKAGKAQQARKTYKLTSAGVGHIRAKLGDLEKNADYDEHDKGQNSSSPANERTLVRPTRGPGKQGIKNGTSAKMKQSFSVVKSLDFVNGGDPSLRNFVESKRPATLLEKCLVSVYWLSNCMHDATPVTVDAVFTCFKAMSWVVPPDLVNTLQQTGSKGWLDTGKRDDLRVVVQGENHLEHDMPAKSKQG
jgi:hypothetical protein